VIRDVNDQYEALMQMLEVARCGGGTTSQADMLPIDRQVEMIRNKTCPASPYARAARSQLSRLPGGGDFVIMPEEASI
jgi:hypothetical protein